MTALQIIIGIILVLDSLAMIAAVLMQESKQEGLGSIAGASETFFGKNKSQSLEGKLQLITKITAVVFVVLSLVMLLLG